jgi:hypothetical protein
VKAIVARHGGSVSVTSDPGVETVFTIHLPAPAGTEWAQFPAESEPYSATYRHGAVAL